MLRTITALLVLFPGSAALGIWLAATFAAGSWLADAVSFFALPVAFAISMQWWYGLALIGLVARLVVGRKSAASGRRGERSLAGSFVFLPVSSTIGLLTGTVVGFLSTTHDGWGVAAAYWFAGTIHGLAGWRLAKAGVLLPPEV